MSPSSFKTSLILSETALNLIKCQWYSGYDCIIHLTTRPDSTLAERTIGAVRENKVTSNFWNNRICCGTFSKKAENFCFYIVSLGNVATNTH